MREKRRVLIVGADGADPQIVARLMAEDKLPHLSRMCAAGAWGPLLTTFPPVSPVAWMTCLTGVPPARHGIRDFITKAPGSYLPTIGLFHVRAGEDGLPVYTSCRTALTVGERVNEAGGTAYTLQVPGTFPPASDVGLSVRGGTLAGFGMPDLVGTFGVSAWYTTQVQEKKASAPDGQALVQPLTPAGGRAWGGEIAGPGGSAETFLLRRDQGQIVMSLRSDPGRPVAVLPAGGWSGWVRFLFSVPGRGMVPGLCRFKLIAAGRVIELYRTPVQCAPDQPLYPLSAPAGFAAQLQAMVGPYATLGMPADVDGVRRGVVDLDTFLQDAYANWEQQVGMALCLMSQPRGDSYVSGGGDWDLLVTHLFTADNVQHLFWHCQDAQHPAYRLELARYGGEIERAYRWLDAQIGRLLERVGADTTLMVVSDHGGLPIYRLFYLNAWLHARGYLEPREAKVQEARIDWEHTRAAMFGTGGIWLNVQGREPRGIVPPGAPYEALRQEIAEALLAWCDPLTGRPVVKRVLRGEEVYGVPAGSAVQDGPDLVVALHPGYGLGRGEGMGRVMMDTPPTTANTSRWSGGHEGPYLPADVPGVCIIMGPGSQGARLEGASLQDIAPTALHLLGIDPAPGMAGRALL